MARIFWIVASLSMGFTILMLSLKPAVTFISGSDKLSHFIAYGVWTSVSLMVVTQWRNSLAVMGIAFVTGVLIEIIQPFIGRSGDLIDVAANTVGILAGAGLTIGVFRPLQGWVLSGFKNWQRAY